MRMSIFLQLTLFCAIKKTFRDWGTAENAKWEYHNYRAGIWLAWDSTFLITLYYVVWQWQICSWRIKLKKTCARTHAEKKNKLAYVHHHQHNRVKRLPCQTPWLSYYTNAIDALHMETLSYKKCFHFCRLVNVFFVSSWNCKCVSCAHISWVLRFNLFYPFCCFPAFLFVNFKFHNFTQFNINICKREKLSGLKLKKN